MPRIRRLAAPALLLAAGLATSGCAGMAFDTGCGLTARDPLADGAARMSPAANRHVAIAQQKAYQHRALMVGTAFSREIRRPGTVNLQQAAPSPFCVR